MGNQYEDIFADVEKALGKEPAAAEKAEPLLPPPAPSLLPDTHLAARQQVVAHVLANPGCRQRDIVQKTGVNNGYVSNLVRGLEKIGLLRQEEGHRLYFFTQAAAAEAPPTEAPQQDNEAPLLTIKTYAALHGIHPTQVASYLRNGRLTGKKVRGEKRHGNPFYWLLPDQPAPGRRQKKKSETAAIATDAERDSRRMRASQARLTKVPRWRRVEIAKMAAAAKKRKHAGFFGRLFGGK